MSLSKNSNPVYPRFTLEDYEKNPAAVKKVNDAALEYLETLQVCVSNMELRLKEQEKQIVDAQRIDRITLMQPLYMVIATILLSFGVNYATSSPHDWIGWLLCFVGSAIQLVVIFLGVFAKLKG